MRRQAEQDEPGEDGRPKKRGRGRPLGSKTKPRPEDELGPADTVEVSLLDCHCMLAIPVTSVQGYGSELVCKEITEHVNTVIRGVSLWVCSVLSGP